MGYFNIFYKITRIIDMLTRKRNRKVIIALCLVGAIVFFSPNISNADFGSGDSYNLNQIYNKVSSIQSNVDNYYSDFYGYLSSINQWENNNWVQLSAINSTCNLIRSDVATSKTTLTNIKNDLDHIDGDFHDLLTDIDNLFLKLDTLQDTADNIESILNSIGEDINTYGQLNHEDQEEIKSLLNALINGETGTMDLYSVSGITASVNSKKFITANGYITYYFPIEKGKIVTVNLDFGSTVRALIRVGYCNSVPEVDVSVTNQYYSDNIDNLSWSFTNDNYKYGYISFVESLANSVQIDSTYSVSNVNDNLGIINQTTIYEGQQTRDTIETESQATRDTITSTNYNQSDVSINTSSIDSVDTSNTDGLFTTIFTNFNNAARGGVDSITIPMPHNSGNLVLYSNVVSSHLGALASLVSAFWYFVFGFYAFKFVNNLLHSIKNGNILDGFKSSSEVITQDML